MFEQWIKEHYWRYPKKVVSAAFDPRHGKWPSMEKREGLSWVSMEKERISLALLIDDSDGTIIDARFSLLGPTLWVGVAEIVCRTVISHGYKWVKGLKAKTLYESAVDHAESSYAPKELSSICNFFLEILDETVALCAHLPCKEEVKERQTPVSPQEWTGEPSHPNWTELTMEQQRAILEEVIMQDIQPYVSLDEGAVKILAIQNQGIEIVIGYEGSCTTCYSATGSTLQAISSIFRSKIYPHLIIVPDPTLLH